MANLEKILFVISLNLLISSTAFCQAGNNIESELVRKFTKYCEANPREEIYLHTDREEYIAGEDLWFSTYLFDRKSLTLSGRSRIAYVELLNSENKPLVQKRVFLEKGTGPGQMVIPDTVSTGKYILRAYTSWMKNFLPGNCFIKEITVYNALSPKGIPSAISEIQLKDPLRFGDTTLIKNKSGVGIKTYTRPGGNLSIILTLSNAFREANKTLLIFIQTRGNINHVQPVNITGESTFFIVPSTSLIPGINQISVFSQEGRLLQEKYIFTPSYDDQVTITSARSFKPREQATLSVEAGNLPSPLSNGSKFSISVAPVGNGNQFPGIRDYLVFGSEFGYRPVKFLKGRKLSEIPAAEMESLLEHTYSNWIEWDKILSGVPPEKTYPAESDNHIFSGRLIEGEHQSAHANRIIFMCMPGKRSTFRYTVADHDGHFNFGLHIDEGMKDLVLIPESIIKNDRIIIESPFSDRFLQTDKTSAPEQKPAPGYIPKWSINYQVSKIYRNPARGRNLKSTARPMREVRFYGVPDYEIRMADYIKLPVMEEVIFELLPQVSLKKKNGMYEIIINEYINDGYYSKIPVLMIDGVVIRDASLIVNLDPETVECIDVIRGDYLVGKFIFTGLINVITKTGNFADVQLPDYMTRIPYRVIDPVPAFASPDYSSVETKSNRIPDYRNTLFWNPLVMPDNKGKPELSFWSTDNRSDYIITVEGITSIGEPFSARKMISVR